MDQTKQHSEVARSEGYRAGRNGLAIGLNPYKPEDELYQAWREGWHQGIDEAVRAMRRSA